MINVDSVSLKIDNNDILKNISARFESGKCYGIKGRNGSGKTMLFRVICGFWKADQGSVDYNGQQVGRDMCFLKDAGVIVGETEFISDMNGYLNLKALAQINNKIDDNQILDTMKQVGIYEARNKKYRKYSLGMNQRLGIAQAIMENPDLLILDEPFNGLDDDGVRDIRKLFLQLKEQGKTIIIASHNSEDIAMLCDVVCHMDKGKLNIQ